MRARASAASARLWVLLPMRGEALGKSRLAAALDRGERMRLNRRLLRQTLAAIAEWQGSGARWVVITSCRRTGVAARRAGALWLLEPRPGRGLNQAVRRGRAYALRRGARGVLVLNGDLPYISGAALQAFVTAAASAKVTLAPDRARSGTNALLLATRARFELAYGCGSLQRHVASARALGWSLAVHADPRLAFDLDTPADLRALQGRRGSGQWYSRAGSGRRTWK